MFKIISHGKKKLTIKAVGDLWLQSKKLNVKSSSYYSYQRNLDKHIYPALGDLKYSAITQSQLNSFIVSKFKIFYIINKMYEFILFRLLPQLRL